VIRVSVDDLAFVSADAVIRPTTAALEATTPAIRRLEQVGGPTFAQQLSLHSELAVGSAVVTGSGDLGADYVVHAVVSSAVEPVTLAHVRRALISTLQRADDWQLARIAMPPLGTGAGDLDIEDVAPLMVKVLGQALATARYPREVCIVVGDDEERELFQSYVRRLPQ
jgi:O-acetyl-ADP-ribose deacetylase (regulator of RNase III)